MKMDEFINFDIIAVLWPCYGLIAMTFIFFAASFLLFISSTCTQFSGHANEEINSDLEDSMKGTLFNCTITTGLLLNSGYFLAFSIVGFIALLKDLREEEVFEEGYIGIIVSGFICLIFIGCQLRPLSIWYVHKILKPQISNEIVNYIKVAKPNELILSEV